MGRFSTIFPMFYVCPPFELAIQRRNVTFFRPLKTRCPVDAKRWLEGRVGGIFVFLVDPSQCRAGHVPAALSPVFDRRQLPLDRGGSLA